ncbi:MAG: EamA family transporter [Candidatus Altiarchaeota archaeon]|nr:EamA family transporter [Candidatus Altiarchaeota archaeon]
MKTQLWAIGLVLVATVIGAFGSLYFKLGSEKVSRDIRKLVTNYKLITGFILYGISSILYVIGLTGGELSVLYPTVATSYIWVCLLSVKYLKEEMNPWKWAGLALIVLGVGLVGLGS